MTLTAPAIAVQTLTITVGSMVTVDTPIETITAFTRRPHKLTKGDTVTFAHGGQMHTTTVTRADKFQAYTVDHGPWWLEQPGHRWGDCFHSNGDYLIG